LFWEKLNSSENNIVSVEAQLLQYPLTLSLYLNFDNQDPLCKIVVSFDHLDILVPQPESSKHPSPTTSFKDGEVLGVLPIKSYL
jgi:hypothetical protein